MTSVVDTLRPGMNGLSHLVEAATALTALVDASTQPMATMVHTPAVVSDDDESRKRKSDTKATTKKREIFPEKLIEILSDSSLSEIISWLPHGRSFVIIRPDIFTQQVLPKYLPPIDTRASTKYPSFTRKLNRWGFRQATRGPDTGAFHHPLFRRDKPELCLEMVCQKSRDRQSVRRTSSSDDRGIPVSKRSPVTEEHADSAGTCHASSVSADERSVCSNGSSSASNMQCTDKQPTSHSVSIISTIPHNCGGQLPFISNDPEFVARILKERNKNEIMKAAQAMLYDAYLKAKKSETA